MRTSLEAAEKLQIGLPHPTEILALDDVEDPHLSRPREATFAGPFEPEIWSIRYPFRVSRGTGTCRRARYMAGSRKIAIWTQGETKFWVL